ncbi:MAG TPA: menaquinone biosynthesis protein [Chitinophagales bacterium]|nr:menaquinone biosynthesis protein [Chitinophagales bacterium]
MRSYKIGVVSYLNARPFLHGLKQSDIAAQHQLILESPSNIAGMLLRGEIDLGLVPVFILHSMAEHHIVKNFCIGSEDRVGSVCLFSDSPVEECHTVVLDSESRTSVALTKVLMQRYFKLNPEYVPSYLGYENGLADGTAGLVIGDRALMLQGRYKHVYDLGTAWKKFTELPFVYAAWISNKQLDDDFLTRFNAACANGVSQRAEIANGLVEHYQGIDVKQYFTDCISYELDERKREGLKLFLEYSK